MSVRVVRVEVVERVAFVDVLLETHAQRITYAFKPSPPNARHKVDHVELVETTVDGRAVRRRVGCPTRTRRRRAR